ncbi:hypothetical protein OIO90_001038 [Microbotryomycetes sp. JL221]|nr:hypothetical protein OIO90_001038 [Microbotryomycetes sp. JL221]
MASSSWRPWTRNKVATRSTDRQDETRPLLSNQAEPTEATEEQQAPLKTPLPFKPILILCFLRMVEPIANTLIYPFIADELMWIGVTDDPAQLGNWAGLVEGLFAFATFSTILTWGRVSDKIGRKPVLIIGLAGVSLSTLAFGFAKTFALLLVARCFGGALNGNVAVIKSMIGELTDESNQGRAFSILPLSWSLGSVLGPMLGGLLANPARHHPSIFRDTIFETFPYALPCVVGAMFPALGILVALMFLNETLTPRVRAEPSLKAVDEIRGRSNYGASVSSTVAMTEDETNEVAAVMPTTPNERRSSSIETQTTIVEDGTEVTDKEPALSLKTLFKSRRVLACLLVYACLALQTIAMDAIFVLFCYSPPSIGGIGFSEQSIGQALALGGAMTVTLQLLVFPSLQSKFGTTKLYRALMTLYPTVVFPMFLIMSKVAKTQSQDKDRQVWIVMVVFLLFKSMANCSYACNMLSITDATPHRSLLGSLNGLAQMMASLCRSLGPIIASSLFAFSKSNTKRLNSTIWFHGQFVFVVMILFSSFGAISTLWLVDEPSEWRMIERRAKQQQEQDNE